MISCSELTKENRDDMCQSEFCSKPFLDDTLENEILDFDELMKSMENEQLTYPCNSLLFEKMKSEEKKPKEIECLSNHIDAHSQLDSSFQHPIVSLDATQIDLDHFFGMLDVMTATTNDNIDQQQTSTSSVQEMSSRCTSPDSSVTSSGISAPPSPDLHTQRHKSQTSTSRATNSIPRHLRESHIRAERKRQSKIKNAREQLKDLLNLPRASESKIVEKAVERCQSLKAELVRLDKESSKLKTEKEALIADIDKFQQNLPPTGLVPLTCNSNLTTLYEKHMAIRKQNNPKFGVFERCMQPLFKSYLKHVEHTSSVEDYKQGVLSWCKDLTLYYLRSEITDGLLGWVLNSNLVMQSPVKTCHVKASTKRQH